MKELDTKIREQAKKDIAERRKPDADISEIGDSIFDLAGASQYAVLYDENAATWNKNREPLHIDSPCAGELRQRPC